MAGENLLYGVFTMPAKDLKPVDFPLKGSIIPHDCKKGISYHAMIDLPSRNGRNQSKKNFPDWKHDKPVEQAKAWLISKNEQIKNDKLTKKCDVGFAEYLRQWHKDKESKIREKTRQKREWVLHKHVFPNFNDKKLRNISSFEIEGLYQAKLEQLSPSSVRIIEDVLKKALDDALDDNLIDSNPIDDLEPLPNPRKEFTVYDHGQVQTFLQSLQKYENEHNQSYRHYPFFYTAINTGLRPGEMLGLRKQDVDLDDALVTVRKSLKNDEDGLYLGPPKTKSSYRTVKLTRETWYIIGNFLEYRDKLDRQAEKWNDTDVLFCTSTGKPSWPSGPRRKLNNVLEKTDLPHITMHEFRHTHATMLLRSGVPIYNVSRRLGHSSVKTTEKRYLDYVPSMQKETVNKYQQTFDF